MGRGIRGEGFASLIRSWFMVAFPGPIQWSRNLRCFWTYWTSGLGPSLLMFFTVLGFWTRVILLPFAVGGRFEDFFGLRQLVQKLEEFAVTDPAFGAANLSA